MTAPEVGRRRWGGEGTQQRRKRTPAVDNSAALAAGREWVEVEEDTGRTNGSEKNYNNSGLQIIFKVI